MGHNPSRYSQRRLALKDQLHVDEYKARSVWGRWWQLDAEWKARLFSQEEMRWIRRYGAKLDELANGARVPRTEAERHFVQVAMGGQMPRNDRERLWVRVQIACRYEESVKKALLCQEAMEVAVGLEAEARALRSEMREYEMLILEMQSDLRMQEGDLEEARRRARLELIRNVRWVKWDLDDSDFVGPPPIRFMAGQHPSWRPHEILCKFPSEIDHSDFANAMREAYPMGPLRQ